MSYHIYAEGRFTLDRPLTVEHKVALEKFAEERHEPTDFPGCPDSYYCQWVPTEDGTGIQYTEDEVSAYDVIDWLTCIITTYLAPWGYVMNGRVNYYGEDYSDPDIGAIFVRDNEVRESKATITISDPFA